MPLAEMEHGTMMDDPLHGREDTSLAFELGRTVGGFAFISVFFAIVGVIAWLLFQN
jgi:hypothetical protein